MTVINLLAIISSSKIFCNTNNYYYCFYHTFQSHLSLNGLEFDRRATNITPYTSELVFRLLCIYRVIKRYNGHFWNRIENQTILQTSKMHIYKREVDCIYYLKTIPFMSEKEVFLRKWVIAQDVGVSLTLKNIFKINKR